MLIDAWNSPSKKEKVWERKTCHSHWINLKEKSSKKVHLFINFIILANWYAMLCYEWLDALDMHDKITSK